MPGLVVTGGVRAVVPRQRGQGQASRGNAAAAAVAVSAASRRRLAARPRWTPSQHPRDRMQITPICMPVPCQNPTPTAVPNQAARRVFSPSSSITQQFADSGRPTQYG